MSDACLRDAEMELMEAAYGDCYKVIQNTRGGDGVFEITLEQQTQIRFYIPFNFPNSPLRFRIDGNMPVSSKQDLDFYLQNILSADPETGAMPICQLATEKIQDWDGLVKTQSSGSRPDQIARFLIYFHHIMSQTKRRLIVENAVALRLGGYSKPGFPGIVIVEGCKEDVLEYVRRIQRLRWQQMVVRGEMIEDVDDDMLDIDRLRKFPLAFRELDSEGGMSEIAALCKAVGLHGLFMTAMKKQTSA